MKNLLLLALAMVLANGSVFKGQRTYMKVCKSCHGSGNKMTAKYTQEEWAEFFQKDAKKLIQVHQGDDKAMKKLESPKFKKNLKHLRQFFIKYASDSGNVPACN